MKDHYAALYNISVVARLTGLHEQTIRQYERLGLIKPQRTPGGTRSFSEADIERLQAIANLTREMGGNLAGVELILRRAGARARGPARRRPGRSPPPAAPRTAGCS